MTNDERKEKALEAISSMAEDLKELVTEIEGNDPVTRGNYDKYVEVIKLLSKGQGDDMKFAIALSLMKAGANIRGVKDAIHLIQEELV